MSIHIEKDGIPYIDADVDCVIFGFGEKALEYSWEEITEIVRADFNNYKRCINDLL